MLVTLSLIFTSAADFDIEEFCFFKAELKILDQQFSNLYLPTLAH